MGDDGCQAGLGGSHPRELRHHHHLLGQRLAWSLPRSRRSRLLFRVVKEGEVVGRVELGLGSRRDAAAWHPCSRTARRRPPGPSARAGTGFLVPCVCVDRNWVKAEWAAAGLGRCVEDSSLPSCVWFGDDVR